MNRRAAVTTAWVLIVLSMLTAAPVLWARYSTERANNTVDLVLDFDSFRSLANTTGQPLERILADLKGVGITALATPEVSLEELEHTGWAAVRPGQELRAETAVGGAGHPQLLRLAARPEGIVAARTYVLPLRADVAMAMHNALLLRLGSGRVAYHAPQPGDPGHGVLELDVHSSMLKRVGFGFDPELTALARRAGLRPVPRPFNAPDVTPEMISGILREMRAAAPEAGSVLFGSNEVVGYRAERPEQVQVTARELSDAGYVLNLVEHAQQLGFITQRGQEDLAKAMGYRVARVYSMGQAEIDKFPAADIVDKWVRSVVERNIRVLYLRPFFNYQEPGKSVLETNRLYFGRLQQRLTEEGFRTGLSTTFAPVQVSYWQRLLMALGAVGAVVVWLSRIWPFRGSTLLALQALGAAGVAGGLYVIPNLGPQLLALAGAIAYPTLAVTLVLDRWSITAVGDWGDSPAPAGIADPPLGAMLREGLIGLALVGGLSLLGGLFVAAMLGDITYLLEFRYFRGVKALLVLPLLLVPVAYLLMGRGGSPRQIVVAVAAQLWHGAGAVVRYRHLALLMIGGVVAFWFLQRSGNFPVVPVPNWELELRAWLERVLVARPRFKEFAIGYPALMMAVLALRPGWRKALLPLLLLVGTAAVSEVDSFAHLRTPWAISLLRSFHGAWLGAVIGVVSVVAAHWLLRRLRPLVASVLAAGDGEGPRP